MFFIFLKISTIFINVINQRYSIYSVTCYDSICYVFATPNL